MKRIAIIGGGISGLSAAFALERQRQAGTPLEYILFESSGRFGGVILTEHMDNCLIEAGPDSFLTEKPWAAELCAELGIADQLIGSNDAQRKTYILMNGKLVPMPDGMAFMVPTKILPIALSRLFSVSTKFRMAREWFHQRRAFVTDESVASFVERHYGSEVVERLADPLLSGVYGGDAHLLSVRAVLPRFAAMEATHGSLGRAMSQGRRPAIKEKPRPLFTSLRNGMQEIVNAIMRQIPPSCLRRNAPVNSLLPADKGWLIASSSGGNDRNEKFDAVILATPAYAAAKLLEPFSSKLSADLRAIQYSSSVTVSLGYDRDVRENLPRGFGYLVPRSEGKRVLAVTFVHNKFPHRAPVDRAIIRCFMGGSRDESALELSQEEILRMAREELRQVLGIKAEPLFTRVYKWKSAMAQYNVGHLERVNRIEELRRKNPSLVFAGNAFTGIGVPDCVRSGKLAAKEALAAAGVSEVNVVASS